MNDDLITFDSEGNSVPNHSLIEQQGHLVGIAAFLGLVGLLYLMYPIVGSITHIAAFFAVFIWPFAKEKYVRKRADEANACICGTVGHEWEVFSTESGANWSGRWCKRCGLREDCS